MATTSTDLKPSPPRLHNVRLDRVVYKPIDELKRHTRQLRKRDDKARLALQSSIQRFGIVAPILIDAKNTIIAGEGIVDAARASGYTDVPTVQLDHLDENEARLLRIALNRLAEKSEWDLVELGHEFSELLSHDVELDCEVSGFGSIEIDGLVQGVVEEDDADDVTVEPDATGCATSRVGDLWTMGDHAAVCGSSLDKEVVDRLMDGEVASMVMTDSPFNVPVSGHVSGLGKNKHREFAQASGEMTEAEFIDFQITSTRTLASACKDGALLYLFMDWRHQWEMMSGIRGAGLTLVNMAVWVKRSGAMGSFYRSQHELCYIAKKGAAPHRNNVQLGRFGRNRTNCWFYPGANSFSAERDELLAMHPTAKNVVMIADAIRDATARGDIVLDGFLGSGTTLIAAERTGRRCRGVELDPLYMDTIVKRWERATGQHAVLHGTGETFAQVAARRASEIEVIRPDVAPRARIRRSA